jgi:hypothetical protein
MKMISAILTLECEDDGLNALKTDILADMNNVVQYLLEKNEHLNPNLYNNETNLHS